METIYNWTISAMDCIIKDDTMENVVTTVHWRLSGTRDEKTYETYGALGVGYPNPANFTAYSALTKEEVVTWIENTMSVVPEGGGETQLEALKANINAQIDLLINPIDITLPPPFSNELGL
jgi:hypothetical protein